MDIGIRLARHECRILTDCATVGSVGSRPLLSLQRGLRAEARWYASDQGSLQGGVGRAEGTGGMKASPIRIVPEVLRLSASLIVRCKE